MSPVRGSVGGIALVALFAVVAVAVVMAVASAAPAGPAAPQAPRSMGVDPLSAGEIPMEYRLQLGDRPALEALEPWATGTETLSSPGPEPTDFPFGTNVPVWTNPLEQGRPSVGVDSQGRIYVAFQHLVTATNIDVYVTWSNDGGSTWQTPIALANSGANELNPNVLISQGDVVTIFIQQDADPQQFWYIQTTNRGGSWTIQPISLAGTPLADLQFPSFTNNGAAAYGMYQVWCTDATNCGGGSWSSIMFWNNDITVGSGWSGLYFAQQPTVELFHPSAGFNPVSGDIVGAMEIEITDNVEWDFTWFRFNPTTNFFSQDGLMCGTFCPSSDFVWPSIAVAGNRAVTGAHFFSGALAPFNVILAVASSDGGATWALVSSNQGTIDPDSVDQKYLSLDLQGAQVIAAYRKGSGSPTTSYTTSTNPTVSFATPSKVSDNVGTTIDDTHATSIVNSTLGPLIAWHDNRDGNANVYFTGFQRFTITVNTSPANLRVRIGTGPFATAPVTASIPAGSSVAIEAESPQPSGTPGQRYAFSMWDDATTVNPRTIAVTADRTYIATMVPQWEIRVDSAPSGRTVTVAGANQTAPYSYWCGAGGSVTIGAPSPQSTGPTTRYRFDRWSDNGAQTHSVACTSAQTIVATFILQYQYTIATNPSGRTVDVAGAPQTGPYNHWCDDGSTFTVNAVSPQTVSPTSQYRWDSWSDGGLQAHAVTCSAAGTATAMFVLQYQVALGSTPAGRTINVQGVDQTTPFIGYYDAGSTVGLLVLDPQFAGTGTRYSFSAWSDGDTNAGKSVLVDSPKSLSAIFTTQYLLTMSANYGTVSPGNNWYDSGELVPISATAPTPGDSRERYVYDRWTGDFAGTSPAGTISMDAPKTVTANWFHQFRVDFAAAGPSAVDFTVDSVPTPVPGFAWWNEGSAHTISAPATLSVQSDVRWNFLSWSGGSTNPTLTIASVSTWASYSATYEQQVQITIVTVPAGRSVTVDGSSYTAPVWLTVGTTHTIDAGPSPQAGTTGTRYAFVQWENSATSTSRTLSPSAPGVLTATYQTQHLLTITSPYGNPTCVGAAEVVSGGCWYNEGAAATVTVASPSQVGGTKFTLVGWSGSASGSSPSITVTMSGPSTLTAAWREVSFVEEFGVILGIVIAAIVAGILLLVLLMRRKKREPEGMPRAGPSAAPAWTAAPPPPPAAAPMAAAGTKACVSCGMEIPGDAATCPVCGSAT